MANQGQGNPAFVGDDDSCSVELGKIAGGPVVSEKTHGYGFDYKIDKRIFPVTLPSTEDTTPAAVKDRATWGNSLEFLMSCIAMSVGLGNVWRFPFTAFENGGGAFLIPYIIVLFVVGKPFYYLEMITGQFTSKSSVKIWTVVPAFKGVGWAQLYSSAAVGTYYCSLMSVTLYYLLNSFQAVLPWSKCDEEWGPTCIDSDGGSLKNQTRLLNTSQSSAEFYFRNTVLREKDDINDGIGLPDWRLVLTLVATWCCISGVLAKGVKSSGKASYFLAIFPYVIMIALLIRAVTLEGALTGIIFFIKPNWEKLIEANVWYAAVTQCFFSLSVCFGGVVMYSSYNNFHHNIYRDVLVVTTLDTLTSLLAGFTIFGILGNLAHELGTDDITAVVRGGTGLAFVSYPDAIAKFTILPQMFAVLFFLMLYILGIGSGIAIIGGVITVIKDQFPTWKHRYVVLGVSIVGFCLGTIYCTPGGQFILGMVDYYAASFIVYLIAVLEITGIFWIYGLENFLDDVEFMLHKRPSIYWRLCWVVVTPMLLAIIFVYTLINLTPLTYAGTLYPSKAYVAGWTMFVVGALQLPFWMLYTIFSKRDVGFPDMLFEAFRSSKHWGPANQVNAVPWREFKESKRRRRKKRTASKLKQLVYVLFGQEDKLS